MITYRYIRNKKEIIDIIRSNRLYLSTYSGFGSLINAPHDSQLFTNYKGAYVAYDDEKVIGICCTIIYHTRKYISCFVVPKHRRKKVGTELVKRYCTNLKDKNIKADFLGKRFYVNTKFKNWL